MITENPPKSKKKIMLLVAAVCIALVVSSIVIYVVSSPSKKPVPTIDLGDANSQAPPYYLSMPSGGGSKIMVTLATSAYGIYPFAAASPLGGTAPTPTPIIQKGQPCFIINVTLRSDYTTQNLPPNQPTTTLPNGKTYTANYPHVYVYLTAKIYDKQGHIITATDVTPPYGAANGGAYAFLNNGDNATVTIYLATNRQDINRFEITSTYIGATATP